MCCSTQDTAPSQVLCFIFLACHDGLERHQLAISMLIYFCHLHLACAFIRPQFGSDERALLDVAVVNMRKRQRKKESILKHITLSQWG